MPIDPRVISSPGDPAGIATRMADLDRRLRATMAKIGQQAENSITGVAIAANTITASEIAAGSITAGHILAGVITASHLAANSVTANAIAANAIQANHIAAGQIVAGHLAAGSVTAAAIEAGTITATQIAVGTITAQNIASNTITAAQIAAGTITATQIAADTITATQIAANAITAVELAANSITSNHIQANAVTANAVSANSIYTAALQAGAVTSDKITVTSLSALTTNMGSMTAGTITGATIQTASSGSRVVMNSAGLTGYALNGTTKVFEINAGTGVASFTGIATLDASSIVPTGTLSGFLSGGNMIPNSSFEQGTNADTGVDQWSEGWEVANATLAKNTTLNVHGQNSAAITATIASNPWIGKLSDGLRMRILPNRRYTLSAYTRAATTARNVRMYVYWYDASNTLISEAGGPQTLNSTTGFSRVSFITADAPSNAVTMGLLVQIMGAAAGEVHYVDAVQAEAGDVLTAYQPLATEILYSSIRSVFIGAGQIKANNIEAGAVTAQKLSLVWGGNNKALNFSAEADIAGTWGGSSLSGYWFNTGATAARITSDAYDGSACVEVTCSGSLWAQGGANIHSDMVYKNGVKYTASIYAKSVSGATQVQLFAGLSSSNHNTTTITLTTAWQRFSVVWTPQADVPMGTTIFVGVRTLTAAAAVFRLDAVQIEEGELPTPPSRRPGEILAGEVGSTQITADAVTTNHILASTIQGGDISASTITGTNIAASTITADRLSVTTLSAITADMGTLTAGTITGGIVRSSATSTRVQMDTTGVYALQAGTQTFKLDAVTGMVTQGKRFSASNQVHWNAFPTTDSVTIQVSADVSLVHIFVEVEVWADLGNVIVALVESTDIPSLQILSAGGASWQFVRTIPGSTIGTSNKLAGYISYRPTQGTRTYSLAYSAPTDQANSTNAYIRNRLIHVFTS